MAALAAANVFPAIGMISQLDVIRRNHLIGKLKFGPLLLKAVKAIVCASVVSMMGAMFLSGILSDLLSDFRQISSDRTDCKHFSVCLVAGQLFCGAFPGDAVSCRWIF